MTVHCLRCGEEIDIGSVGHDESDGELHATIQVRRGFRESSAGERLHTECFKEAFDKKLPVPGWADD